MRRSQSEGKKTDKEEKTVKDLKVDEDDEAADADDDDDDDDDLEATFGMSFLWDIALKALDTEVRVRRGVVS